MRLLFVSITLNVMCVVCSPLAQLEVSPQNATDVDVSIDFNYKTDADDIDHELGDYDYEEGLEEYDFPPLTVAENETDYSFPMNDRARWSYAPGFVEQKCTKKCKKEGKPFGRLLATKCTCWCPLNARDLSLCATIGACDKYCASIGFAQGGDCVFNNVCFCICGKKSKYDVNQVYTTPATVETTEMYNIMFYNHKKWRAGTRNKKV